MAKLVAAKKKKLCVKMPDFMGRLKKNYGNRAVPDSQSILNEMREDR
jgi:hypothetical protein